MFCTHFFQSTSAYRLRNSWYHEREGTSKAGPSVCSPREPLGRWCCWQQQTVLVIKSVSLTSSSKMNKPQRKISSPVSTLPSLNGKPDFLAKFLDFQQVNKNFLYFTTAKEPMEILNNFERESECGWCLAKSRVSAPWHVKVPKPALIHCRSGAIRCHQVFDP